MSFFDTLKQGFMDASDKIWTWLYDATHPNSPLNNMDKPKLSNFDTYMQDPSISKKWKAKMLSDLQAWRLNEEDANNIISKIYLNKQNTDTWESNPIQLPTSDNFQEHHLPWVDTAASWLSKSKFKSNPDDNPAESVWKSLFNFLPNAWEMALGGLNMVTTAWGEAIRHMWEGDTPIVAIGKWAYDTTAHDFINPTIAWVQNFGKDVSNTYNEKWALPAIEQWVRWVKDFVVENPAVATAVTPKSFSDFFMKPVEKVGEVSGWKSIDTFVGKKIEKVKSGIGEKGIQEIYEAVNPTTRENKALLRENVKNLLPYIDEKKLTWNELPVVKDRVDTHMNSALEGMKNYEDTVWVKWTVNTDAIANSLRDKYQEKIGDSYINPDAAKMAQTLIDTLEWFGKEVKDADIIKIRRAWDDIIEKNKWFMQSADGNLKADVFYDANKFFRKEIKASNPEYAKFLADYAKTRTLSDILDATIQRRTGQIWNKSLLVKTWEQSAKLAWWILWNAIWWPLGGAVGYWATDMIMWQVSKLWWSSAKLARGKKAILKSEKNGNNISDTSVPSDRNIWNRKSFKEIMTSWPWLGSAWAIWEENKKKTMKDWLKSGKKK